MKYKRCISDGDVMEKEEEYLKYTLDKCDEIIEDAELKLKNLPELYKYNYEAMIDERFILEHEISTLEKTKLTPYFARIDFESSKNYNKCYIGKTGVIDYDNKIIVVDWRAPISSLYYDSNLGRADYESPEGTINGNLLLKRQYTIENGKLINYSDVDVVSNDELLKPYLAVSSDKRLKNIVSTIQAEQNKIIREPINKNLIIQGVAGSGKTTVALHRIAYLVYNFRDIYKPQNYMVIGPNKFFTNYISSVLPDLDVNGVPQNTFEELFISYLKEDYTVQSSLDKIVDSDDFSKFRTSLELKAIIDNYFKNLNEIPVDDLKIGNIKIIEKGKISEIYSQIDRKRYKSVKSRVERCILLLNRYVEQNFENLKLKLIKNNVDNNIIVEFKNNVNYYIKKHFNILNLKSKKVYIDILKNEGLNCSNISKNIVEFEDLAPLMYINYLLVGNDDFKNYKHIVIDEAQDYGEFAFLVLRKMFGNSTFSIYGDLAQSLYSYRSIDKWDELNKIFKNLEVLRLNKSYRTTIEIMDEANKINDILKLDRALPVIRHGDNVEYFETCCLTDLIKQLRTKYDNVAIITKDQEIADDLFKKMSVVCECNLVNNDNLNCGHSINVLPSYLSKGLEFDSVIIIDDFNRDNMIDLKLFYVSMTRALHKLIIVKSVN